MVVIHVQVEHGNGFGNGNDYKEYRRDPVGEKCLALRYRLTRLGDGALVAILVEDGQGVRTGMPLFKIATHSAAIEVTDDVLHQSMDGSWQNRFDLLRTQAALVMSRALLGGGARPYGYAV
jgi:hypothetical protein